MANNFKRRCGECQFVSPQSKWLNHLATASQLDAVHARWSPSEDPDVNQRIIKGTVAFSTGIRGLGPGQYCILRFGSKFVGMRLPSHPGTQEYGVPYLDVEALEVSGRGTTTRTSDAGIMGGGFGVEGALKGMAMASAVNYLTRYTTSTRDTEVRFKAGRYELLLLSAHLEPVQLRMILAPVYERIDAAHSVEAGDREASNAERVESNEAASVKARLQELGDLHDAGLITEEEFSERRSRILDEL